MTLPARTFGIELEVIGTMAAAQAALTAAGVVGRATGYTHQTTDFWKVVPDGSVTGGCEVVSPILSGEAGLADCRRVAEALTAAGLTVNSSTGFHVHVGASDLGADDLRRLTKRYADFEPTIDGWMPPSRRGTANGFCEPASLVSAALDRVAPGADASAILAAAARVRTRMGAARYVKLNLTAFFRHGTVEFRQHSGTVDADKVDSWVRFCLAFVEASRQASPGAAAAAVAGYAPRADYVRREARRNWAEIIEQVEAAGLTMAPAAPRSRTYRVAGPAGEALVSQRDLGALYSAGYALDAVRFEGWWQRTVAPLAATVSAGAGADDVFAGVPANVADFYRGRAAHFARRSR